MVQKTINIIDVITTKTKLKQMDIAKKLGVSRAQISKWKSGEYIPYDRRQALNEMAGLFGDDTEWALLTKNPENAEDWIDYFTDHHQGFLDVDTCRTLTDEAEVWVPQMLILFNLIGIKIPENARNIDTDVEDEEGVSKFGRLMTGYLESYSALTNWHEWNISSIENDEKDDIFESTMELQSYIVDYALRFVDEEILTDLGADLSKVSKKVEHARKEISKIIEKILIIMLHNNIPIMKNYFDIINKEPYDLDDDGMILGKNTIESCLPLFERTILSQNAELFKILGELHLKVDTLLKPEDKEKLSKILEVTPPLSSIMEAAEEE